MPHVGEQLEDFSLKDQDKQDLDIEQLKGKKVLLSFHPLAWTSICAQQMKALEENIEAFNQLNTVPLGLSIDHSACKNAWAKELGIQQVRLLADFWPHGEVAKRLGIFRDQQGISERANIIIDETGKIIFVKVYEISQLPDLSEIFDFLKNG